ncbi:hypothetical protein TNCV_3302361 [Trichonephila clavipes]|nr:hypothetical protein TNCV_3302361 [Trichonephila clavipes]
MTYHNRLEDFLKWRVIGRLEVGQSQSEVARWDGYWALRARQHRRTTAPQLARDLAAVPGMRSSRQAVYSRLAEIGLYVPLPVWYVTLTASSRKERI